MVLPKINSLHRNYLIAGLLITKLVILIALYSRMDMYDYHLYFQAMQNVAQGLVPWANGVPIYYPPFALIPMGIGHILVSLTGSQFFFIATMWVINAACDLITTFCIYWIGLKLYNSRTALTAAILYATGISIAYFSLTKFDSIPTCLATLAILFTIYGDSTKGYAASIAGLFTKLWPIVTYPFTWIYDGAKLTLISLSILITSLAGMAILMFLGWNTFLTYTSVTYCNTIPYAANQFMMMLGINTQYGNIILLFHCLTIAVIAGVLVWFYRSERTTRQLLQACLITIAAIIFLSQYRSPQYLVWMMPFAALLLADSTKGIIAFIAVQIIALIEFPIAFYTIYTNDQYLSSYTLAFFVTIFIVYGAMVYVAMQPPIPSDR